jgi:hypothetical protein
MLISRRRSVTRMLRLRKIPSAGDDDADGLQQVRDGEGLVEDAKDLLAQFLVRLDQIVAERRDLRPQFALEIGRLDA